MAKSSNRGQALALEADDIQKQMTETRQALSAKLNALKQQVFEIPASLAKKGKQLMATKKAVTKSKTSSAAKSKAKSVKSVNSKTKRAKSPAKKAKPKGPGSLSKQLKRVAGEVLTAAAGGALQGAVGAVLPRVQQAADTAGGTTKKKAPRNQAARRQ